MSERRCCIWLHAVEYDGRGSRVRFLPPLDDRMFQALKSVAIALLDPYPVGMHIPVLEAIQEGIPVVSFCVRLEYT